MECKKRRYLIPYRKNLILLFVVTIVPCLYLLRRYSHTGQNGFHSKTKKDLEKPYLYFMRIPKTGSLMFSLLLSKLGNIRGFRNVFIIEPDLMKWKTSQAQQEEIIKASSSFQKPVSYSRELYFIDFNKFNNTIPIMFSQVREPAKRVHSGYYYIRDKANSYILYNLLVNAVGNDSTFEVWKNTSLETCLHQGFPECNFIFSKCQQINFFCGNEPFCSILNNRWALEKAKSHVLRYFPVVGVLEMFNETLKVLEDRIPFFFKDASRVHSSLPEDQKHFNKLVGRKLLSAKTAAIIRKTSPLECDFYQFLVQRLSKQYSMLSKQ